MELNAFKGKSEGKGKSSKGEKGTGAGGKSNPDKDVVCHLCGKKGHRKSHCWHSKANGGSGQPPGQKGTSSKSGKSSQPKGKGQGS